ncbi:distal membrane arm assembly component 2 [Megachile rotundata]|uniref:distal membrane arm assembly component 2 n=1 Tax=Megachile rotundata TaxID=143995 RepID=UPI003FD12A65
MLHVNLLTKMFHYSAHGVSKSVFYCIVNNNKININAVRLFYNDKESINHFLQYLRKRHSMMQMKYEDDERKAETKTYDESTPIKSLLFYKPNAPEMHDFFTFNWKYWWEHKKLQYRKIAQKYRYDKNEVLGPDIATAKFILISGGRVKFANQNDWIDATNKKEISKIPTDYQPEFILEGLDLRGYPLEYENLYTICNLYHLKWLSLRGCDTINDWSIDKLAAEYPNLEYLDISECKNVTDRGLQALYKTPNLKQLIVTDFTTSAAFELTCLLLQDINPYLNCKILKPEKELLLNHG